MVHNRNLSRRQLLRTAAAMGGVALGGGMLSACSTQSQTRQPQTRQPQTSASGPASSASSASREELVIGFVPIACASPLVAADALGAFEKQGLHVKLRKYAGWADLWTAYATGTLDVAHMLSPMPLAIDAGATNASRPTELAFTQNTNGQALTLSTSHLGAVSQPTDLAGMVLGIPFEYSVHALLLRDYLVAGGLDPVSDVELRLLRPPDMVAQLAVGAVDGFIGPEPFNQRALTTGSGHAFIPTRQMWENHPCCSVAIAKEIDRGVRDRVVAALREGAQFVDSPHHVHEAASMLAEEKYLNQKEELISPALAGSYTTWDGTDVVDPDMINFGGQTSATAITWMAAQIARWDLGGTALTMDDDVLLAATASVLPPEADRSTAPVEINGRIFDPLKPTAGYQR
ncbi:ABC transporter substrate-binding protein [Corynebacterium propinquum]|uniref:ABC transporter substrate-binding protein n=1 Tax=Corynebacterium propinquum TaxID=43769 RepID=UPI00266FC81A|nr:ABC transporter substrate-binding protein [Corynebacterium propinquum]WKS31444.1 ABC transporter substrate-binding protein [Corynebacterium propinquum]WKS35778.1 ABC transporter substrate-binding protein [Corynebacterium propinquum]WKS37763.1 ABC transporter substrate-binding protein [Corynebacterium propinquum]WKS42130.1 ABC transporter substrate-binding protein [Corynebacterium propinquum]WKS46304.1 ABC transporter substrate-binding protein [Corynebacterium propinquum]